MGGGGRGGVWRVAECGVQPRMRARRKSTSRFTALPPPYPYHYPYPYPHPNPRTPRALSTPHAGGHYGAPQLRAAHQRGGALGGSGADGLLGRGEEKRRRVVGRAAGRPVGRVSRVRHGVGRGGQADDLLRQRGRAVRHRRKRVGEVPRAAAVPRPQHCHWGLARLAQRHHAVAAAAPH